MYVTNPDWFEFLRSNSITNNVNFWRKDKRKLNLEPGNRFYFKLKGTEFVAGRATFSHIESHTLREAWNKFGYGNGAGDFDEFKERARGAIHIETDEVSCVVLNNVQFLKDENFYTLPDDFFPRSIMAMKFFEDSDLPNLTLLFDEDLEMLIEEDLEAIQEEESIEFLEGRQKSRLVNYYERNRKLRAAAVRYHGTICKVCGFDFHQVYGDIGHNFIEVHHLVPVSSIKEESIIDYKTDMTVLCSNCHRMVHKRKDDPLTIDELRQLIATHKGSN